MVDIGTRYLGLSLRSPLVASSSPLTETLDGIRALEDAGVGAVVLFSMFEEQLTLPPEALHQLLASATGSYAEALALLPDAPRAHTGPFEYLEYVRAAKDAVDVPIVASVNGTPGGAWAAYARLLEHAGADAIELNLYHVPSDPKVSSERLEAEYFHTLRRVREVVRIPVAVKLHPFFTSLPHAAGEFERAGADGLVLFNRFYQPLVDIERMRARPRIELSRSEDLRLPLRWVSILRRSVDADLAITGGVHTAEDALSGLAVGAQVVMLCSALLKHGPEHLRTVEQGMRVWLEARGIQKLDSFRGTLLESPEAREAIERAQYMRALHGFHTD